MRVMSVKYLGLAAALCCGLLAGCERNENDTPQISSQKTEVNALDSVISSNVKHALMQTPALSRLDFNVSTLDGVVTLRGFVDERGQIERSVQIAKGISGVKAVVNNVDVRFGAESVNNKVDNENLASEVRSALLSDPVLRTLNVAVVAHNGEVMLSGFVERQGQIDAAVSRARKVKGVQLVASEIIIKN